MLSSSSSVKCWPTDLAAPGSRLAVGRNLFYRYQSSIAYSLSLSNFHHSDLTEIVDKKSAESSVAPAGIKSHKLLFELNKIYLQYSRD